MDVFKQRDNVLKFLLYLPGTTGKINEPIIGRTRLVKILYLLSKENNFEKRIPQYYTFHPYMYGPYSREIFTDLNNLIQKKLVHPTETVAIESFLEERLKIKSSVFTLTTDGVNEVKALKLDKDDEKIKEEIREVKKKYNEMPLSNLVSYIYNKILA